MKRISIIGSNSFLAKNLVKYIEKERKDYEIYKYDRFSDSEDCQTINFESLESINKINFDVDAMFIFVGRTGLVNGFKEYDSFIAVNEVYLLHILTCYVQQTKRPLIIYPGSRLIFAGAEGKVSEAGTVSPKSVYAVTKMASEAYLEVYAQRYGLRYVILRICTPYGSLIDSYGNYGTLEIFFNQAKQKGKITVFGDGSTRKTYTQMQDICAAFLKFMEAEKISCSVYNLGGTALSIGEVASGVAKETGATVEYIPWPREYEAVDGGSVVFDSSRFDEEFSMMYHDIKL